MSAGDLVVTAVCGGGNDAAAFVVAIVIAGLYAAAVLAALSRAEDGEELALLIVLVGVTAAIGAIFFLYPNGISGNGDYLGRFVLSLVVSGLLGAGAIAKLGEQSAGRALFLALAGDVLVPGGLMVFFFSAMLFGTGCLD